MRIEELKPGMGLAPEALRKAEDALASYAGRDQVVTFAKKHAALEEQGNLFTLHAKCFPNISADLEGFQEGELILVSGPPKNGKTLLLQSLHADFARQGYPSLWFSYEVGPRLFLTRLPDYPELPEGYVPDQLVANTIPFIYQRAWEAKLKYDCRIVMIDHIHYLVDMARMKNPSLEIGGILRALVRLAVELNMIVFVIQHIGKLSRDKDGELKEPDYGDIRDSSFSCQEPSTIMMVWRGTIRVVASEPGLQRENDSGDGSGIGHMNTQMSVCSIEMSRRTGVMGRQHQLVKTSGGGLEEIAGPIRREE